MRIFSFLGTVLGFTLFFPLFSGDSALAENCGYITLPERPYSMAASSDDRSYYIDPTAPDAADIQTEVQNQITQQINRRANWICKNKGCGGLKAAPTLENDGLSEYGFGAFDDFRITADITINESAKIRDEFALKKRPWYYGSSRAKEAGNIMWNVGHTLNGFAPTFSLIKRPTVFCGDPTGIVTAGTLMNIGFAITGQALTMCSRPLERDNPHAIPFLKARKRIQRGEKLEHIEIEGDNENYEMKPHLLFKNISCEESGVAGGIVPPLEQLIVQEPESSCTGWWCF